MMRTSLLDPYHALHMIDLYLSGKMQFNSQPYQKAFSGPVKSIPKDFSDANTVEDIPRPCQKPVKSIPKDFSEAKPVNGDKVG